MLRNSITSLTLVVGLSLSLFATQASAQCCSQTVWHQDAAPLYTMPAYTPSTMGICQPIVLSQMQLAPLQPIVQIQPMIQHQPMAVTYPTPIVQPTVICSQPIQWSCASMGFQATPFVGGPMYSPMPLPIYSQAFDMTGQTAASNVPNCLQSFYDCSSMCSSAEDKRACMRNCDQRWMACDGFKQKPLRSIQQTFSSSMPSCQHEYDLCMSTSCPCKNTLYCPSYCACDQERCEGTYTGPCDCAPGPN